MVSIIKQNRPDSYGLREVDMIHHVLKIKTEYFLKVCAGIKNFELRKNDRDYQPGDTVEFLEWTEENGYTGAKSRKVTICYVLKDVPQYGLAKGYCIFGWND